MATKLIGLAGSLRKRSLNHALLRAAAELAPEGVDIDIRTLHGIPVYDGDVEEAEGLPEAVVRLKDAVAAADGLLIVSPEYNGSLPGPLKNGIDWMTRGGDASRVFGGLPLGLMGVTPGRLATAVAQSHWLHVFMRLSTVPYFGSMVQLGGGSKLFDEDLKLVDDATRDRLAGYVDGFAAFAAGSRRG